MNTTVITCIFDLAGEENSERRSADDYIKLGLPLLNSDIDLIVFGDIKSLESINKIRSEYNTKLIPIDIKWLYEGIDQVRDILVDQKSDNPSKNTAYYYALIWAKLSFLNSVSSNDPFGNTNFLWMDIGLAHITNWNKYINVSDLCNTISKTKNKIHITLMSLFPAEEYLTNPNKYWTQYNCLCSAALIGGDKAVLSWLFKEFWSINRYLLDKKSIVTWEEKILGYLTWKYPSKFQFWYGYYTTIGINWGDIRLLDNYLNTIVKNARESSRQEHKLVGYLLGKQLIDAKHSPVDVYDNTFICAWYADSSAELALHIGKKIVSRTKTDTEFKEKCYQQLDHINGNLSHVGLKI